MNIKCPNCGYEIELTTDMFSDILDSIAKNHPGFIEILTKKIVQHKELFEEVRKVVNAETEAKAKADRALKEEKLRKAQRIKDSMTVEEKIRMLNTPYEELDEDLQIGMTRNPEYHNQARMHHPHIGEQQERSAARILRFRTNHGMDEQEFCNFVNLYAKKYDIKKTKWGKGKRTRLIVRNVKQYENFNTSPKAEKMAAIAEAMGMPVTYFEGYGKNSNVPSMKNEILAARYHKNARHVMDDPAADAI